MGSRSQPMGDSTEETEEVCQGPGRLVSATHWRLWWLQGYPWRSQGSAPQLRGDLDKDMGRSARARVCPLGCPLHRASPSEGCTVARSWWPHGGLLGLGPKLRGYPVKETGEVCQGPVELPSGTRQRLGGLQGWQELGELGVSPGSLTQRMEDSVEETQEVCQGPGGLASASRRRLWQLQGSPRGSQGSAPHLRGDSASQGHGGGLPGPLGARRGWPLPPAGSLAGCRVARSQGPWVNPGKILGQHLAGSVLGLMLPAWDRPRDPQAWRQLENSWGPQESPRQLLLMPGVTLRKTWGNSAR